MQVTSKLAMPQMASTAREWASIQSRHDAAQEPTVIAAPPISAVLPICEPSNQFLRAIKNPALGRVLENALVGVFDSDNLFH